MYKRQAKEWAEKGEKVVLVLLETSPEDMEGMVAAQGILTVRGGMTSHAAVVARGMGTCCVSGCGEIKMDEANKKFELAGKVYNEGDYISLDGSTGNIYGEAIPTVEASISGEFGRIMDWADKYRTLRVRTNADNPRDAKQAKKFGAEGIGLCRTEHMFFEADRIPAIREMIDVYKRQHQNNPFVPYIADDVHHFRNIRALTAFVHNGKRSVEPGGKIPCTGDRTQVRGNHHNVVFLPFELLIIIRQKDRHTEQMIHRNIEKALNLRRMQVHGQNAVRTGSRDEIRNEFCGDRVTRLCLTVLSGIAEIRDH